MSEPTQPPPAPVPLNELPEIGKTVFMFEKRPSGTWKHTAGKVLDVNQKPVAVKIEYAVGFKTVSNWFPLTQLTATAPMKEIKK